MKRRLKATFECRVAGFLIVELGIAYMTLKRSSSIKSNGPPRKKAAVDDKKSLGNAKPKAKPIDSKPATEPVRKQPITKTAVDTASASDDDGSDEDVEIGVDEAIEDENLPPMDVDPRPPKDPNGMPCNELWQRLRSSISR